MLLKAWCFFFQVDVDENDEVAEEYNINSLPNFMCFKNGFKVDSITGADEEKLEDFIKKHV